MKKRGSEGGSLAYNRKAGFDIDITEKLEAGLVLTGDEIKSVRAGRLQLTGGYIRIMSKEVVVIGLNLSLAKHPERVRKILLKQSEIEHLQEQLQAKGRVAVALDLHLRRGWAKLTIGIGTGRKLHDKRQLLKDRDTERDLRREAR